MKVLIAGAGRLGRQIAQVLTAAHNRVTLVDRDEDRIAALRNQLPVPVQLRIGDACEPSVLEAAGAHTADLVIATTGEDEDNLVISLLAKRQFSVQRVVARVNDAENAWLFNRSWGVDAAVPAATPLISLIEEATGANDTVALLRLSKAGVDVIETTITPRSRAVGSALADITIPEGTVVAAVVRDGSPVPPTPALVLAAGDEILLVSHSATESEVHAVFQ
ncbi:TrkA family potassium uptake protein [Streptomyces sp. TRM66268-LWL]|uniref:Trk system potassium uptake protein TrkA n=1 Tax=Streptomyces polyasparticus TaxID=2767826 RepID=A0ABR7SHC9_9ACTN|nr:TrkA family potassium uptake protein [Streptomyces polyasparticus]MBC9713891.1 TrkA family potassium uptake protein [Streptomyces polyasparticus]